MEIREIQDKERWNETLLRIKPNTFLHSWEWGQVQKESGENVRYLGFFHKETIVGAALLITVNARRGKHYLCPHGPLFVSDQHIEEGLRLLISFAKKHAASDRSVALRVAPLLETGKEIQAIFQEMGFTPAPLHVHAELTWVLPIEKNEEEILSGMRKTTRHAIKKAQKSGVTVDIRTEPSTLDRFWPLYTKTTNRHGFVPFPKKLLQQQVDIFSQENRMFFAIAVHQGKDVAGAILMHFADTVFYYHGASVKTSVPAAQLLQWEAIREAKKRGAARYNFWGIAPDNEPDHPFAGITVFKKGFGGQAIDYLHAQDLPLSPFYWKLWFVETIRKHRRGFR